MAYSLSNKLRNLRLNRNLTQSDVGKHISMTRQGYAHYEKGTRTPDYKILSRLASFYQLSLDELIDENELPIEIAYLYESNPYSTNKNYKSILDSHKITIKVSTNENKLISLCRQLSIKEQNLLIKDLEKRVL